MSFKDPNHGIGGSEGTIHDGGGVLYPGGNPSGHIPGWPESSPGEPGHGDGGWHEPYNDHCWDYNDYYYNCEYTDYCYEPSTYEFHCGF